jgi:hypothetical protein
MSRASVMAARQSFSDWGFWPRQRADIDPEGWLANFDGDDQQIAEALLDAFVFFNSELTEQLFISAFKSISSPPALSSEERITHWRNLIAHSVVTFPGEEDQNPTDSGHRFATIARNQLGVSESNIYRPADAVRFLRQIDQPRPLIIVDDFIGTGTQVLETWTERVAASGNSFSSLGDEVLRLQGSECHLVVAVATSFGIDEIKENAPELTVHAAHILPLTASLKHPQTSSVPDGLAPLLPAFVEKYSRKAGMTGAFWGYGDLATSIGFEHGIPDATLPLYWYSSPAWVPLRRRQS